jgi:hypothetical protein
MAASAAKSELGNDAEKGTLLKLDTTEVKLIKYF